MKQNDLFPCRLWEFEVPVFFDIQKELITEIYNLKHTVPTMLISNRGGWQSPDLFSIQHRSNNLKIIINKITKTIESELFNHGSKIKIDGMWYNVNPGGSYNDLHDHPGADLAAIFYIKVPRKSGNLVLMDPFTYKECKLNAAITPLESIRSYSFTPTEGKFIMFPGHLLHRVETNRSKEDRISIAFNINIIRL
jgi:uncharacterized protein (TIGR02466 family)